MADTLRCVRHVSSRWLDQRHGKGENKMRITKNVTLLIAVLMIVSAFTGSCSAPTVRTNASSSAAPVSVKALSALPSWAEGPTKSAIIQFVQDVTKQGGPHYVRPEERIATFDNDGTLWVEYPMYTQVLLHSNVSRNWRHNIRSGKLRNPSRHCWKAI